MSTSLRLKQSKGSGIIMTNPAVIECLVSIEDELPYIAKEHIVYCIMHYLYVRMFGNMSYGDYVSFIKMIKKATWLVSDEILEWEVADELLDVSNMKYNFSNLEGFIVKACEDIVGNLEVLHEEDFDKLVYLCAQENKSFSYNVIGMESISLQFIDDAVVPMPNVGSYKVEGSKGKLGEVSCFSF